MEVHFTLEMEKKLGDIARQNGQDAADRLVQNIVEGYFEELAVVRDTLGSRYDDLKSGRVKPIPGDEVEARFRLRSAARRRRQPGA